MNYASNGAWSTGSVTTAATGTNFVKLPEQPADFVSLSSSVAVEVRKVGATAGLRLPADTVEKITVSRNLAEIEVRRADTSDTQAAVTYLWRKADF